MRIIPSIFLVVLFVMICPQVDAQVNLQVFDAAAKKHVSKKKNPGLMVAYLANGEIHYKSYGKKSKEIKSALTKDDLFEIGGITQVFTAALMMQVSQEGLFDPADCLAEYLPKQVNIPQYFPMKCVDLVLWPPMVNDYRFPVETRACHPDVTAMPECVTFCQLATHNSGLRFNPKYRLAWNPFEDFKKGGHPPALSKGLFYQQLAAGQVMFKPGSHYLYSANGMTLLGQSLAEVKNQPYEDLVQSYLLDPLELKNTFFKAEADQKSKLVQGHDVKGKKVKNWELGAQNPAAGLKSNAEDLIDFLAIQLDDTHKMDALFYEQRQSRTDTGKKIGERPVAAAYGWMITPLSVEKTGPMIFWVNGGTHGQRSFIAFNRVTKTAVVVLSNSATPIEEIGFQLMEAINVNYLATASR